MPPCDALDDILECLIEDELSMAGIAPRDHLQKTVERVWRMLDIAGYKHRQAPPGVRLTRRAFGRDHRYPIVNGYRGRAQERLRGQAAKAETGRGWCSCPALTPPRRRSARRWRRSGASRAEPVSR